MAESIHDFISGIAGGCAGILMGHPADTVKIRMQTAIGGPVMESYIGAIDCFFNILRQEGIYSFYRGMASPLLGVGALNATLFTVYGSTMRFLEGCRGSDITLYSNSKPLSDVFISGACAGTVACVVTTPTELLKCQLQVLSNHNRNISINKPLTPLRGAVLSVQRFGWRMGLFRGWWATILRDTPSYGVYFMSYQLFCDMLRPYFTTKQWSQNKEDAAVQLIAGGSAGCVAWFCIYPFDVIKSRLQVQAVQQLLYSPEISTTSVQYSGVLDCFSQSVRTEGWRVLFRGVGITMIRAFPVNAATFVVYEISLKYLSKFNNIYQSIFHVNFIHQALPV